MSLNLCAVYPLLDREFPDAADWLRALDDVRHMADVAAEQIRSAS